MSRQSAAETPGAQPALDGKRKGRLIAGVLGLLLGAWYTWYTWGHLPMGSRERPGAGVFPLVIGFGLILTSLLTVAEAWRSSVVSGDLRLPTGHSRRTLLGMAAAILAFVIFYQVLGQYVASCLFMIAALSILGSRSWVRNVLYGVAIGVALSAFFVELLGVRLPEGLLGPTGLIGSLFL
jgi:putative tricarboxylic transport membrane protein